jgi:hypothetical protein
MSEQWNLAKIPSYISVSSELINRTYIGFSINSNKYIPCKLVDGKTIIKDKDYFAFDLLVHY